MPIESTLERAGEPRLSLKFDAPEGPLRARLLMVHGYAEHSARYDHVVAQWVKKGFAIARYDHRGHGRSEGPRGHVDSFAEYLRDLRAVLDRFDREAAFRPAKLVLFGHSLGGLIASRAAIDLPDRFAGLALTSPFFGLAKPLNPVLHVGARFASRFLPGLRNPSGLSGADMSHDPATVAAYDRDRLGFHHATARFFTECEEAQRVAIARAPGLRIPTYCVAAGDDRVVSVKATRRFFDRVGATEKELEVRPRLFHEVLNEPEWPDIADRLADRMLRWASR